MSKKKIKKRINFSDETLNFTCEIEKFKEEEETPGRFTGILVNMQNDSLARVFTDLKREVCKGIMGKLYFFCTIITVNFYQLGN